MRSIRNAGFIKPTLFVAAALVAVLIPISILAHRKPPPGEERFERIIIDALDPDAWNGVVFMATAFHQRVSFGLRAGSRRGTFLDGQQIFHAVSEVGAHAPDASYCRVGWRHPAHTAPVTLEWSRLDETTVVGRLASNQGLQLVLETYFPDSSAGITGDYSVDQAQRAIWGEKYFDNVFERVARLLVMTDRPLTGSGTYHTLSELQAGMSGPGLLTMPVPTEFLHGAAGLEFTDSAPAHFVAILGWDKDTLRQQANTLLEPGKIDAILKEKSEAYAARRPAVEGLFAGAPEAIGNSMFWNTLYAPQYDLVFPSISRHWAHAWGNWVVGEWDCFFDSLLTSLEDEAQTASGIRAILSSQTADGVVPNMASGSGISPDRSEPPVAAYVVWKVYQRREDRELLAWAYPRLKKYHECWFRDRGDGQPRRDGNRDGLLEWGSDRGSAPSTGGSGSLQAAKWESGMDDSPMWDDATYDARTFTLDLDDVGLNSLYTLDAECLARIAAVLGEDEDRRKFAAEYEHMKRLVREKLWNDKDGMYENLFWDGHFSRRLSPTNFYPMLAGIATAGQAGRMVKEHLLNPAEFWGKYVIPTIARNDPAFADQFYWRGDIWGPTNYMVYEGLDRYHFDRVALEYAEKNYDLFMEDWRINQHDDEEYYAWGGSTGNDSSTHYTWGALLCLIPLEQYIDVNPWEGLRFGALDPPAPGEFHRIVWQNHTYDVRVGPHDTLLARDGQKRFAADAGVVVRKYQTSPAQMTFVVNCSRPADVTTREFDGGELKLEVDGKPQPSIRPQQGSATFRIPAGEHTVALKR